MTTPYWSYATRFWFGFFHRKSARLIYGMCVGGITYTVSYTPSVATDGRWPFGASPTSSPRQKATTEVVPGSDTASVDVGDGPPLDVATVVEVHIHGKEEVTRPAP